MASGVFTLPLDILVSGILTAQSGSPYTARDPAVGFHNHPGFYVGPYGPQTRAVAGELAPVNGERNDAWTNFDFRLTKRFDLGGAQLEALFEVFNVLSTAAFRVSGSDQQEPVLDDGGTPNPEFGLGCPARSADRLLSAGPPVGAARSDDCVHRTDGEHVIAPSDPVGLLRRRRREEVLA